MPNETALLTIVFGFLLVLTRVGAFFAFIPIPGSRAYLEMPKIILCVAVTLMLFRFWEAPAIGLRQSLSGLVAAIAAEAAFGLAVGTGIALVLETAQIAAQFISLQAGFSYASTIDPNSEADSGILLILFQLLTSLCVFSIGLDRQILAALAESFERIPAGSYHLIQSGTTLLAAGTAMFQIGFRLSLPVLSVLLIADIALALLGKIEQQLQLSNLMFPLKTLAALIILATIMTGSTRLLERSLVKGWMTVKQTAGL